MEYGKKITIDSSTLMNKVFEVIEAKKIFNLEYNQIGIIIHPQSFVHAILKFSDGMIKIIAHETTMEFQYTTQFMIVNIIKLKIYLISKS